MIEPYVAVCMQPPIYQARKRKDVADSIGRIANLIGQTVFLRRRWPHAWLGGNVRLVAFPEFCFSDCAGIKQGVVDPMKVAVEIPGDEIEPLTRAAKENNIYIAAHALELVPQFPDHYMSTMFIIGPNGQLIYKRHKLRHLLLTLYTSPNDILDRYMEVFGGQRSVSQVIFPVVETEIGILGMCACHEVATPEVARQLTAHGAEVIIRSTNEPDTNWSHLDYARAIENVVFWVMSNSGPGVEDTTVSDYGCSRIIGFRGELLAESRLGDTTVGGAIDVERLRQAKGRLGLPLYSNRVFDYYKEASIPPNMFSGGRPERAELEKEYVRLGLIPDRRL